MIKIFDIMKKDYDLKKVFKGIKNLILLTFLMFLLNDFNNLVKSIKQAGKIKSGQLKPAELGTRSKKTRWASKSTIKSCIRKP